MVDHLKDATGAHKYTDEQLHSALETADIEMDGISISSGLGMPFMTTEIQDLRAILEALPEPAQDDEWVPCTFAEIRKGDRVRWVVDEGEDKASYEIVVQAFESDDVLHSKTASYYFPEERATLYRIPALVQRPDPFEHPVIVNVMLEDYSGRAPLLHDYATSDGEGHYICWKDGKPYIGVAPSQIVSWEPADIVPRVVEADDR